MALTVLYGFPKRVMIACLFGRQVLVRYGSAEMMLDSHKDCGHRRTKPAVCQLEGGALRRLRKRRSRAYVVAVTNDCVVATMPVTAAGFAFLLDVRDLAACRQLAITANDASTGECGEAK